MADKMKLKVDKTNRRVEVEIGEEHVAFTFEFLQSLAMDVMQSKTIVYEKEIPFK